VSCFSPEILYLIGGLGELPLWRISGVPGLEYPSSVLLLTFGDLAGPELRGGTILKRGLSDRALDSFWPGYAEGDVRVDWRGGFVEEGILIPAGAE
jgi:hypothetical protein